MWNPAHHFTYSEYFRRVVLLAALGKFEFPFTDSDVLTEAKSHCSAAYRAMSRPHFVPNHEDISFRHLRSRHASGTVYCFVVATEEPRQFLDVTLCVFVRYVFEQILTDRAMATLHYSAFHIRVSTDLKLKAFLLPHGLEFSVHKLFYLIRSHPDETSAYWFRILCEYRMKCRAHGCARLGPQRYDM